MGHLFFTQKSEVGEANSKVQIGGHGGWCRSELLDLSIVVLYKLYIPVGISRVTLGKQIVDYNPPALGWVYYNLGCLRFFGFTTKCKTIDKLSLLQVALYLH